MYILKERPEDFIVEEELTLDLDPKGEYTYFILKKTNWTTLDALDAISQRLHVPIKRFNYCGIKDRNAITTQYISAHRVARDKLESIRIKDIEIIYVGKGNERLKLGQLTGNKFTIIARNLDKIYNPITFVENYYDDQRFAGTNHLIGRAFAKRDWNEACDILKLRVDNNDPMGTLRRNVTRKMLQFYLNAYQSYLWNEVVRRYLETQYHENWTADYHGGILVFSNERVENKIVPLLGYLIQLRDEDLKPYYETIMDEEGIKQEVFLFPEMPELRSEGNERDMFLELKDFKIKYENDREHKGKKLATMQFTLPAGSYATMVLKKLFSQ